MLCITCAVNVRLATALPGTDLFQIILFSCTMDITHLYSGQFVFLCTVLLCLAQRHSSDRAREAHEGYRRLPRMKRKKQWLVFLKSLGRDTGADVVHYKHIDTVVKAVHDLGATGCGEHANTLIWLCGVGPMRLSSSAPSPQPSGVILAFHYPRCPDSPCPGKWRAGYVQQLVLY